MKASRTSISISIQIPRQCSLILGVACSIFYFWLFCPPFTPHYPQLYLFCQSTLDPNRTFLLALPAPRSLTCGITTQNPPRSSPSMKTLTKPFISFCWRLQTNCMSNPYATNASATGRPLLESYWIIFTLHTLTFPPPHYRTTTRDFELPTTAISSSKPWSIRSKTRLTTPSPETRHTPLPRSSELPFSSFSKPSSSTNTTSSGNASQQMSRPGHTSRNFRHCPTIMAGVADHYSRWRFPFGQPRLSVGQPWLPKRNGRSHRKPIDGHWQWSRLGCSSHCDQQYTHLRLHCHPLPDPHCAVGPRQTPC